MDINHPEIFLCKRVSRTKNYAASMLYDNYANDHSWIHIDYDSWNDDYWIHDNKDYWINIDDN